MAEEDKAPDSGEVALEDGPGLVELIGALNGALKVQPELWVTSEPWRENDECSTDFVALLAAKASVAAWEIFGALPATPEEQGQWQDLLFYQLLAVLTSWSIDREHEIGRGV